MRNEPAPASGRTGTPVPDITARDETALGAGVEVPGENTCPDCGEPLPRGGWAARLRTQRRDGRWVHRNHDPYASVMYGREDEDQLVRAYVSRLWAQDWNSAEDSVYD